MWCGGPRCHVRQTGSACLRQIATLASEVEGVSVRGRVTKIINNDALTCHKFGFVSFLTGDINLHDAALAFVASLSINCSDFLSIY